MEELGPSIPSPAITIGLNITRQITATQYFMGSELF